MTFLTYTTTTVQRHACSVHVNWPCIASKRRNTCVTWTKVAKRLWRLRMFYGQVSFSSPSCFASFWFLDQLRNFRFQNRTWWRGISLNLEIYCFCFTSIKKKTLLDNFSFITMAMTLSMKRRVSSPQPIIQRCGRERDLGTVFFFLIGFIILSAVFFCAGRWVLPT